MYQNQRDLVEEHGSRLTSPVVSVLQQKVRILHLEDDRHDRLLIHQVLHDAGFNDIKLVSNEADFQKALAGETFDLVLSDKLLPGFDGLSALRIVREKYPRLPFVFVSGSMGEEAAIDTFRQGATDYVMKDRLSRLIPAVTRALREAEQAAKSRQAEEKIREQAALLDLSQDAIMVLGLDQNIRYWNQSAERLYGWTSAEAVGQNGAQLLFHQANAAFGDGFITILANGKWSAELSQFTKDGKSITVECHWSLVRNPAGEPHCILAVNTDITGKKALEAQFLQAQRLESVGALASGIAHDLNNCLSPILMGVGVLTEITTDPSTQRILAAMESSAARGAGVVKQVLTFARGAASERVAIQPNHLVKEIVKIIRETFPRSISAKSECAGNLWPIEADATQIYQVLLNLCVNARDAMPDGGTLTISSGNVTLTNPVSLAGLVGLPGDYVRIDVKDSGTGIPPEVQEKMFQPFFTTKEIGKGTGLGLSTTVSILGSHHGLLGLQSAAGVGTTFSLFFPRKLAEIAPAQRTELRPVKTTTQDLILLVDDEAAIREMCKFMLESCNYRVLTAENGAQALALFQEHKDEFALVVSDSNMPVMGGATAVRAMRWSAPNLKIISTSGGVVRDEDIQAADPKLHRYLAKPYTAERLLNVISELLGKKEMAEALNPKAA